MRVAPSVVATLILAGCGLEAADPGQEVSERQANRPASAIEQQAPPQAANDPGILDRYVREPEQRPQLPLAPWIERMEFATISHAGSQAPDAVRVAHLAHVDRLKCHDERVDYQPRFDDWHRLDIDGDGSDEYLVFFTLEGFGSGNNYSRRLAVYRYVEPVWFASYSSLVGGQGSLAVSGLEVRLIQRVLTVAALFPDEDDPMCCPSMDGEIAFDTEVGATLRPRPVALSEAGREAHSLLLAGSRCD